MSLIDLIKKEDNKYISVNDFIELIANTTKDTSDVVIQYLGKFCLSDNYDVSVYIKGFGNGYSCEFHLSDLIFKDHEKDDFRFYTMNELKKDDEFSMSYLLKDEIFNIEYIKTLNLNYDSLTDDTHSPNKENAAYQKRIADLEKQLADEKANDRFGMGMPKLEQGEPKDSEQIISDLRDQVTQLTAENNDLKEQLNKAHTVLADTPADDANLNPKTLSAITRLLNVLFHKAQLDITAHKGTTNKNIVNSSISLNAKITEKPVSHWIRQVQQLRIDTQDSNH